MKNKIDRLAIISGSGELPQIIIDACKKKKIEFFALVLDGEDNKNLLKNYPSKPANIAKIGDIIKTLKKEKISHVVLAGTLQRPAFSKLRPDLEGVKLLAKILKEKALGDDSILKMVIKYIEKNGFEVIGAHEIAESLLAEKGFITKNKPNKEDLEDINFAVNIALSTGILDIGQSLSVKEKRIIAVEAAEGTDAMIKRTGALSKDAILVKIKKPNQETKVDLPTIGLNTIKTAKENNIRGIVVEAGGTIILDKEKVIKEAKKAKIFILGIDVNLKEFKEWQKENFSL